MAPALEDSLRTPVDELLEEQRSLTAVDRFSRRHEPGAAPSHSRYYRDLMPMSPPGPGEQYSFEVDLDRCSGCQACVTACHSLNGLDDNESWRSIGFLHSDDARAPFQATVTTACHHCVDPGCLNGCPVLAYDKDPVTGIVRHLDDQCIGCQYCVMKCPYEVPQYSAARGIVRKCDMCSSRLEHGEAPACVQACPTQAIRITIVDTAAIAAGYRGGSAAFLPASPEPSHTLPTTRFVSSRPAPEGVIAGDHSRIVPADAHAPLVFMLVLSQMAAGGSLAALAGGTPLLHAAAAAAGLLAVGVGSLHLGQPLKAWRCFLGWRASWFSREVIVFGAFVPTAAAAAAAAWHGAQDDIRLNLDAAAALAGAAGVACSAMLYADTPRRFWSPAYSFGKFFGTELVLGSALALALLPQGRPAWVCAALAALTAASAAVKLALERRIFRHLASGDRAFRTELSRTAHLLRGTLSGTARLRIAAGVLGGILLPILAAAARLAGTPGSAACAAAGLAICLSGELLERRLFFMAVSPDRMPGRRSP